MGYPETAGFNLTAKSEKVKGEVWVLWGRRSRPHKTHFFPSFTSMLLPERDLLRRPILIRRLPNLPVRL